jgi:hypothetical protein
MDVLESALYQLREHDDRAVTVRLRAVRHDLNLLDSAVVDQRAHRSAAARLVVDALAVLADCGGLASDVAARMEQLRYTRMEQLGYSGSADPSGQRIYPAAVHDTTDQPDPHLGPVRRARVDGADYCSVHDLDGPCPHDHATPGRYPAGPEGDALAFADLDRTDDD